MTTEQSPLVQRAVQRLRDGIARREMNLDLEAIKAVLVEMATQKERADGLDKELGQKKAALATYAGILKHRDDLKRERDDLLTEVRILNRAMVDAEEALASNRRLSAELQRAYELLAEVEANLWAHLEDIKEEQDKLTFEVVSALHDKVVLFLGKEAPER